MGILERLSQRLSDWVEELSAPEAVRGPLQRGIGALQAGDYAEAEVQLARVVTAEPRSWRGWQLLGLSQLRGGRIQAAVASLSQALRYRPDEFAVLATLGEAQRRAGQNEAALQSYKAALHVRADESMLDQVFAGLGEIYLEQGELDHAIRELRKAVAMARGLDLHLLGKLGVAQYRAGELKLAESSLSRAATAVPIEPEIVLLLSRVLLEVNRPEEARLAALRLLQEQPHSAPARCALARALLALDQKERAREELLRALGDDASSAEAHHLLGRLHAQAGDLETAARHLRTADQIDETMSTPASPLPGRAEPRAVLWRELLELGLELERERSEEHQHYAARLLQSCPGDPLGTAVQALGLADSGRALELLRSASGARDCFGAQLAAGILQLARGQAAEAVNSLRTALRLRPGSRRGRALLATAHRALAGLTAEETPLEPGDLYPIIRRTHELFLSQPPLSGLGAEVALIQEVFDRPLLVTVMGEFNSGKSTFVNALIGERVAPMGVTPTTATINVLKYGPRRGARVIRRDDREELLEWPEVEPFLSRLDRHGAASIRLVEILYPSEELLRVNVVDTPGLNSMIDEHEQTAREVMAQADAVIWLFSAQQAGKQTEEQALEIIAQHKLKTIGVLNKVDRLNAEELAAVLAHLRSSFGALAEEIVPVSARQALEALLAGDGSALAESRFPALRQLLEERLFARGRAIKRVTAERRLASLLASAERRLQGSLAQTAEVVGLLDQLRGELPRLLPPSLMEQEAVALRAALDGVYRRGAEEVLEFVQPRRWALGEHRAAPADRDFLLELLVDGLQGMAEASHQRMAGQLRHAAQQIQDALADDDAPLERRSVCLTERNRGDASSARSEDGAYREYVTDERRSDATQIHDFATEGKPFGVLGRLPAALLSQLAEERAGLLEQQVYTRYLAFARGLLLGGRIDQFFARRLPHLELALEPIHQALLEDSIDLDRELLDPLGAWYGAARAALSARLSSLRVEVELDRLELEQRGLDPLLRLRRRLVLGES